MTRLLLPIDTIKKVVAHGRGWPRAKERGGILLGYRKAGAIEVTALTYPGRWDRASAFLFERSARGHRARALKEWKRSGHLVDWVGEWHTHPGGVAYPSSIDRHSWAAISRHACNDMAFLIFNDSQIYAGLQSPHASHVVDLTLEETAPGALLLAPGKGASDGPSSRSGPFAPSIDLAAILREDLP